MSYNDPKTTRPVARSGGRTIWMVLGALVVVLIVAWFLGLFGGPDGAVTTDTAPAVTGDGVATTTEPAAPAPAPSQ